MQVEILRTKEEQKKGFQGRNPPGPNEGLLFLYDQPSVLGFWMKDVEFPLQLLAFDEKDELFQIINLQPNTQMIRMINKPCCKVIEVEQFWCAKNKIQIGAKLTVGTKSGDV